MQNIHFLKLSPDQEAVLKGLYYGYLGVLKELIKKIDKILKDVIKIDKAKANFSIEDYGKKSFAGNLSNLGQI